MANRRQAESVRKGGFIGSGVLNETSCLGGWQSPLGERRYICVADSTCVRGRRVPEEYTGVLGEDIGVSDLFSRLCKKGLMTKIQEGKKKRENKGN